MSAQAVENGGHIVYTIFRDTSAAKKYEIAETWGEVVERIKSPAVRAEKSALPLISMGVYGDSRSANNALRHQANLLSVTGIEGDYDDGVVPLEDAAERLGMAGIKCVLYTTPSHKPEKPRWRVLAPLSCGHPPGQRARMVARVNGILGGILKGESFTTSQSFYLGKVEGCDYEVISVDGDCIDTRDEFDQTAIMPAGKSTADSGTRDDSTDDELRASIRAGERLHESLRSLAARFIGRGMSADDVAATLEGLMDESAVKGTDRWHTRRQSVARLVASAAAKYADPRQDSEVPAPPADERFAPFNVIADDGPPVDNVQAPPPPPPAEERRFNLRESLVGLDTFDCPPDPPEQIVDSYMLRNVGVRVGAGGGGKSTLDLFEAIHLALGRAIFGLEVRRPGAVLILTAEDERDIARWRLFRMARDMNLSRPEIEHVAKHIYIEDATRFPCRFVDVDQGGRLIRTAVLDELVEVYKGAQLAAIFADPQNAFGPGERFINDGEAELMRAGAWLSAKLNCAVRFTHHVGKGNARSGVTDQYAGRGGSAGADNARFVHLLVAHTKDGDADGFSAPAGASAEDIAEGRLLRLHVVKLSHGKKPAWPFWLLRRGFTFEHLKPTAVDPEVVERERIRRLCGFVRIQATDGIRHTRATLEDRLTDIGFSRSELRATLHIALQRAHLIERELPESERRGGRKNYLANGAEA